MFQKMRYNNLQDYAIFKIIFSGLIQVANPMHLDDVIEAAVPHLS